ncbi:putative lipid II flippase FtsW [Petroclostridium sp. X23]|uniref:putative lipid II flippase FtsW n=1 Tax=Petroclostridium sp. X23 TaxID=3045146 RepID=UPI0024AE3ACC|nr:putative lipid II flippase FtsW [Petroclostridium sp. X23]WHH58891.1 putative lipid II flippase FtsW [Petroclostridium sp. X23]
MKGRGSFDFGFFVTVMILLSFGLIIVFSASSASAFYDYNDSYHVIKRQLKWAVVGLFAMFFMANFHYKRLEKLSLPFLLVSILLLIAVLVVGNEVNGAQRWLGVGGLTIQPSEVAKLSVIVFFSARLAKTKDSLNKFFTGLLPYLMILGVIAALVIAEPHLSGTMVIVLVGVILLYVAGARVFHFLLLSLPAIAGLAFAIYKEPYRMSRVVSFLDPWKYKMDKGWQIIQSLYAIGSGGLFGLGLGRSRQKFLYIPEAHNDFIFSILCEELGFIGAATVLILFIILIWRGIKIALNAPDAFGSLLATGIISLIAVQVLINIAVVTSSMPVTGMPLPFFSAGGSSLLFIMAGMGIILNISRYTNNSRG